MILFVVLCKIIPPLRRIDVVPFIMFTTIPRNTGINFTKGPSMKIIFLFFHCMLSGSLLIGCGASKPDAGRAEEIRAAKERMAMDPGPTIPPGNCKVAATVVSISTTMKGNGEKDPCGTAPCIATVRIDSVLGYGSAFPKTFSAGEKITMKFANTLRPTEKNYPDVKPALPGLSVGSKFVALVNGQMVMGQTEPAYVVYGYEKK